MMKISKIKKTKDGFTVIELIISLGLFIYVVTISLGAVLSIFSDNNKSQSVSTVMNNLSYSLEDMSRAIRFSTAYHCDVTSGTLTVPNSCSGGGTSFAVSSSTDLIAYRFNNNTIEKSINGGTYLSVLGSNIILQYARFYVFNTTVHDNRQPYIILVLKGYAGTGKPSAQTYFDLETLISQRQLDL